MYENGVKSVKREYEMRSKMKWIETHRHTHHSRKLEESYINKFICIYVQMFAVAFIVISGKREKKINKTKGSEEGGGGDLVGLKSVLNERTNTCTHRHVTHA